ncbi:transposase ORF A, IS605 family [Escherichia coli DEC8B]|nr:transposase ORF A, IS605 family [Escherichia coli DEC8B]
MTRQKNYALTFQMYVLILKLKLVEMDGEPDHVHLLINYLPNWRYPVW